MQLTIFDISFVKKYEVISNSKDISLRSKAETKNEFELSPHNLDIFLKIFHLSFFILLLTQANTGSIPLRDPINASVCWKSLKIKFLSLTLFFPIYIYDLKHGWQNYLTLQNSGKTRRRAGWASYAGMWCCTVNVMKNYYRRDYE